MVLSKIFIIFVIEIITTTKIITTMTVKELIDILKDLNENANIFCSDNAGGGYILTDVEYNEETNQIELS